ncbi:MAG: UdgX family uracil-DNA binding protein [Solirubrobacteraceae bacterium]
MPPESHAQKMLEELRGQANDCHACPLWRDATQTVFGEGPVRAVMMLVGEQPGDREDRDGRPFVGPAGALLDRALAQAGIDRTQVYVTNAVKHFKYRSRGKRRIHQRPDSEEIKACYQWLQAELELVKPCVLVCLGATAAKALLGGTPHIERDRGRALPSELAPLVMLTAHPSAVLRQRDHDARQAGTRALVRDLRRAWQDALNE